jgi:ankyrin repeat protein
MTIMAVVLANELVNELGGFATFECAKAAHAETLAAYAYALAQVGATNASHACTAAAELVRDGRDTGESLAQLESEFNSQDPPLVGLLADFMSECTDPWFQDRVNTDALTAQLAKVDDVQVLWNAVDIGHFPLVVQAHAACLHDDWAIRDGTTILHIAVRWRPLPSRVRVADFLIAAGAPLDVRDRLGWTPLHVAAELGGPGFVTALLAAGASPTVVDNVGYTPLHRAEHAGTASALLQVGVSPNTRTRDGYTPLHTVRRTAVIELLLKAGADALAVGNAGQSVLHHAVEPGGVHLLVDGGADPNARTNEGVVPLMTQADAKSVAALLERGAELSALDQLGRSVLHHYAGSPGTRPCLELLLARGADPTLRDSSGKTALDVANEMPIPSGRVVALLEEALDARSPDAVQAPTTGRGSQPRWPRPSSERGS